MDPVPHGYPILKVDHLHEIRECMATDRNDFIATHEGRIVYGCDIHQFQSAALNVDPQQLFIGSKNIDFYMGLLADQRNKNGTLYAVGTGFYESLCKGNYDDTNKSIRNVRLLQFNKVFIPVEHNNRWKLAVIYPNQREIVCYDSTGEDNERLLTQLKEYIKTDSIKRYREFDMSKWQMYSATDVPEQIKEHDSGVFVCACAESLARNQRNLMFTHEHMAYFRNRIAYEIATKYLLD